MKVTCFLPCRRGSERVPRKNIRPLAGRAFGLLEVKLEQLLSSEAIDQVILSTNDEEIVSYAEGLNEAALKVHRREDRLASSETSTDSLVSHAASLVPDGHILWTHVTSPFVTARDYDAILQKYEAALQEGFDSLMSVTALHGFLWDEQGPINYDRHCEKWPRTQTLKPVYEVNSAAFVASSEVYRSRQDRIGENPFKYVLERIQGFDIDWQDDFRIAEALLQAGVVKI
ncbi:cytidylyltransferase domain-containing protein [Hydrocarboniclastica marina]|uniref:Acylneuraminate cytidylyltransferase family protein n=1 Tax=Hydrocarboniclastica marina TaxID=2259620 RepID=A0A4P7XGW4_9ALTE|nr:acylneuraminate cytidylyltransferase family protein [Hydrocarboniclastica marina]QCF25017.1 acylneuraminate cytidylyltransferase family protein [Hydrocarboniclastica marina]